jgi:hypothetical protein
LRHGLGKKVSGLFVERDVLAAFWERGLDSLGFERGRFLISGAKGTLGEEVLGPEVGAKRGQEVGAGKKWGQDVTIVEARRRAVADAENTREVPVLGFKCFKSSCGERDALRAQEIAALGAREVTAETEAGRKSKGRRGVDSGMRERGMRFVLWLRLCGRRLNQNPRLEGIQEHLRDLAVEDVFELRFARCRMSGSRRRFRV